MITTTHALAISAMVIASCDRSTMTFHAISRDGTSIGCARYGAGPPLVLVHGTTADHTRWAPIGTTLEQRFTVYACDRRGRGLSADAADYTLAREVEDIVAVAEAIGEPIDLLGHSHGAIVALEAARHVPVKRLVLYEPPIITTAPFVDGTLVDALDGLLAAGDREGALVRFLREGPRLPADQIDRLRALPAWQGRVAAAHTIPRELRANLAYRFDPKDAPTMPTLLLLGGASPPPFRAAIEHLATALPKAKIGVMPGEHHAAMDTAPSVFLREVLQFLD